MEMPPRPGGARESRLRHDSHIPTAPATTAHLFRASENTKEWTFLTGNLRTFRPLLTEAA